MAKDLITIDIGSNDINIVVGNANKIQICERIIVSEKAIHDDKLYNLDEVRTAIKKFLIAKKVTVKEVGFVIRGRDVIIRQMEVPVMPIDKIAETAIWEFTEYLPEVNENYYIDFEIINKNVNKKEKTYKVMIVAVSKEKVNRYIELARMLDLKVVAIDVAANSVARVFSNVYKLNKSKESIGIIDIGSKSSSITILDKGNIFMQRDISLGIDNMLEEFVSNIATEEGKEYETFINRINFMNLNTEDPVIHRIKSMFDRLLEMFQTVATFYTSGKANKMLDSIYLIGEGCDLIGIQLYIKQYLGMEVMIANTMNDLKFKIQSPQGFNFKFFVHAFGMLLRSSENDLNLLPDDMKRSKKNLALGNRIKFGAIAGVSVLVVITIVIVSYFTKLYVQEQSLAKFISDNDKVQSENKSLKAEKAVYDSFIEKVDTITKNKKMINEKIRGFEKYVPNDVVLKTINYTGKDYSFVATTPNYASIAVFTANLQTSKEYPNARIQNVIRVEDRGNSYFQFNIIVRGE